MSTRSQGSLRDADIRPALRSYLARQFQAPGDAVFIEELGICRGQVRADLALVNGQLHGYEIKSDRDTPRRLANQVDFYSRVFSQATVVVGKQMAAPARQVVPPWRGILQVTQDTTDLHFRAVRRARSNPRRDPRALVEFLWLKDAIALLEQRGAARGVRGKPRRVVWDRICEHFDVDEVEAAVRHHLKARADDSVPPPQR
jgi:hypothetical protein